MIPVILVVIESLRNRVVGTFDIDNFESWWISEPLPGDIDQILAVCWVHGDYHFALARMMDGTYSVFRSNDVGQNWELIWNHSQAIHGMIWMNAGWVIFSTADGWYETVDTGADIHQVAEGEPDSGVGVRVSGITLISHDGDKLWKSPDAAREWGVVYDLATISPGLKYPCVAGNLFVVLAGAGRHVIKSSGSCTSWQIVKTFASDRVVKDIMMLDGAAGAGAKFIVQVELVNQGIFRYYEVSEGGTVWTAKWDRYISPGKTMTGATVQTPIFGGTEALYFTGGVRYDPSLGKYVPALSYSRNGVDWVQINIYNTHTSPSTPFLYTTWTEKIWHGPKCHNWGYYEVIEHVTWGLSWETRAYMNRTMISSVETGSRVVKRSPASITSDVLAKRVFTKSISFDGLMKKEMDAPVVMRAPILKTETSQADSSVLVVGRPSLSIMVDSRIQKQISKEFWVSTLMRGELKTSLGMGAYLVTSKYPQILIDMEIYFPQYWQIRCPLWKYKVWDSRKGTFD